MRPFATIVAAVDFSDTSRDVVQAALALARDGDGRVCLIHAVPAGRPDALGRRRVGRGDVDLQCQWVAEAEAQLVELVATLRLDPAPGVARRRRRARSLRWPLRHAAERGADLLVLGSHGHGVIRRFLLGNITESVLREAGCPVVIVPDRILRATAVEVAHPARRGIGRRRVAPRLTARARRSAGSRRGRGVAPSGNLDARWRSVPLPADAVTIRTSSLLRIP